MRLRAPWLADAGPTAVIAALEAAGFRALFVGGCVRDGLLGRPVSDIDFATDARPEATMAAAAAACLRTVPTGIEHGTVTVLADGRGYEVTTFRRDEQTDGRHAVVAFTDRLEEDAARRDFTMNALYADGRGRVIDPVGGMPDLAARRVRFIGVPAERIAEDYLRILRFFRFHAWYAPAASPPDAAGLAACAEGMPGLRHVSAERIGHEMRRLLAAPDPGATLAAMASSGVLDRVLPGAAPATMQRLLPLERSAEAPPDAMRRLAALEAPAAAAALRLSRAEASALKVLNAEAEATVTPAGLAWRHGIPAARDIVLLRCARQRADLPEGLARDLVRGAAATLPVTATDLQERFEGPELGRLLRGIEARWLASDLTASRAALLAAIG